MIDWVSGAAAFAFLLTIAVLALVIRILPLPSDAMVKGSAAKIHTLDGLRGVVALGVVVHHAIMTYLEQARGRTGAPESHFQNQLGSTGVAIFFMISAYLFCGALIRNDGRLDLVKFVESRLWRIIPLYSVLVCLTVFCAFYLTDFTLLVSPQKIVTSIVRLGLFSFVEIYPVNTANILHFFGQVWTLRFEWMLYALLPILGYFMRIARSPWPLFFGLFVCSVYNPLFSFFVVGAAAWVLVGCDSPRGKTLWQILGLAGFLIVLFGYHDSRAWPQAILLTPFFIAVLQGRRWFALLGMRPLRLLGDISFSLYLLHPFSLWIVSHMIVGVGRYPAMGMVELIGVIMLSAVLSIGVGVIGFKVIEQPLMGQRPLSNWLDARKTKRTRDLDGRSDWADEFDRDGGPGGIADDLLATATAKG
ncbi:acyltransferase [Sphingomonas paeninsulae]|uniref:Acyltransferase n=1 Tax=Sphingomonas paeninsulae TaxID=2319844 RepID=A0A494T996_SPHPE|nr:acyltransferase [Sphingomonas paeninsulae]